MMSKKNTFYCPNCGRHVTGKTANCPWCHTELPFEKPVKLHRFHSYGLLSLFFAITPIPFVGWILGGFSMAHDNDKMRTLGKVGILIASIVFVIELIFLGMLLYTYYLVKFR